MRGQGTAVGHAGEDIELLDGDLVNLVENVDAGDIDAVGLDHVDELVRVGVLAQDNVGVVDAVLSANGLDLLVIELGHGDRARNIQAALVLFAERDRRWLCVEADAVALEFALQDFLMALH